MDAADDTDLFGEPVRLTRRGRGRPEHKRTRELVNRVILGLARGLKVREVALSIGISVPTLRQHYSSELARRHAMTLMMESVQLGRLNDQAAKGNVAAEKELMKALARGRLDALSDRMANRQRRAPPPPKAEKLGKKAAANQAAAGVKGKYAPPPAPLLLN